MATLPPIQRISKEDLRDAPNWVDRLLIPLNQFLNSVYGALSAALTFDQNFQCQIRTIAILAGASAAANTASFQLTMKAAPRWAVLTVTPTSTIGDNFTPDFLWNYDGENVNITSISGLTNGQQYSVKILLI